MLRRTLERLARRVVLRRALPADFRRQRLYVTPDARLAYLFRPVGGAERRLLGWARERVGPGASVWDVGANCGVFAIAAALRAGAGGRVLALEPDPFLAGLLRRSARLLGASDAAFEVLEAAVAEAPGHSVLNIARRGRAASWLEGSSPSTQAGGFRARLEVVTVSLDSLLERHAAPVLVKIDVEGSEARALRGASRLLSEIRPELLIEVSAGCRTEVGRLLAAHAYEMLDAEADPGGRLPLERPAVNTLALPRPALRS